MAQPARPPSQGLTNPAVFAKRASLKYELRRTSTAWGFFQSAKAVIPHLIFKAPSGSDAPPETNAESSSAVQEWRIWRDGSGCLFASTPKMTDTSSRALAMIVKGRSEGGEREVVGILRMGGATSLTINDEYVVPGKLYTLSPDDIVCIDNNEYIYRYIMDLGEAPTHCSRYSVDALLGEGAEGAVELATCNATQRAVAIKTVKLDFRTFRKVADEIRQWERFTHPNVASLIDWCTDPERPTVLFMVLHLAPHQSLLHYIARNGKLPEQLAKPVIAQVINGLMYMHEEGFLHRDIKPENILVFHKDKSGVLTVKIGDFGTCIPKNEDPNAVVDRAGTATWAAPEVAIKRNTEISDVFCVGGVMYFILFKKRPFLLKEGEKDMAALITTRRSQLVEISEAAPNAGHEDSTEEQVGDKRRDDNNKDKGTANNAGKKDRKKPKLSDDARDLLRGLLNENPSERWGLRKALNSPWLQGCTTPKGRVPPLTPRDPLVHNLVALVRSPALAPPYIPEWYRPEDAPAPAEEVVSQMQPGPADKYVRCGTKSLTPPPPPLAIDLPASNRPRPARSPAVPAPVTEAAPVYKRVWTKRTIQLPASSPRTVMAASSGSVSNMPVAGPSREAYGPGPSMKRPLVMPEAEPSERVPVPPQDAVMDVDLGLEAAEEAGATGADTVRAAATLKAPLLPRTGARARARKNVASSLEPPVRRSARIRNKAAGTVDGTDATPRGAQAASGVKVQVATGEKRKAGARSERSSKKRRTD